MTRKERLKELKEDLELNEYFIRSTATTEDDKKELKASNKTIEKKIFVLEELERLNADE